MTSDSPPPVPAPRELDWDRFRGLWATPPKHVAFRKFASETVLLNVETGTYYGMDETGWRFFELMCRMPTLDAACNQLVIEYDASKDRIRHDLMQYCQELVPLGLIELRTGMRDQRDRLEPQPLP